MPCNLTQKIGILEEIQCQFIKGKIRLFYFLKEAQQFGNSASDSKALNSEWLRSTKTWAETRKHCERRNTEGGGSLRLFVSFPLFGQKPCIGGAQSIKKSSSVCLPFKELT